MGKLVFEADAVRRVVEHALAAPKPGTPAVLLVHDHGVYMMSNGDPRDIVSGEHSFCAYAKGCDPDKDEDWYEQAHYLVGGDDFGETLPWCAAIKKMLDDGASKIVVNCGVRNMSLSAVYPKGKGPQRETRPETVDELIARLRRMMRTKIIAFSPDEKKLKVFAAKPTPVCYAGISAKFPNYIILNNAPVPVFRDAVVAHKTAA